MGLNTIYKLKGFSSLGTYVPGNQKVYNYLQSRLPTQVLGAFNEFYRCPPTLVNLYESLLLFDRPSIFDLPPDPDIDFVFEQVVGMFRPRVPYRVKRLQDISVSDLPQSTNPGYPYSYMGYKTKADAWNVAKEHAWVFFDKARRSKRFSFHPAMIFAKGAICHRSKVKTRFINGESLSTVMLECCFANAIEEHQFSGATPAAYDYTPFSGGYDQMRDDLLMCTNYEKKRTAFVTSDFSKYDKSGVVELTNRCYDAYLSFFDFGTYSNGEPMKTSERKAYLNVYSQIKHHHVYTPMLMPDGYVYEKDLGDNSGSKMFQKIQNMRTCFLVCYAVYKQYGRLPNFIKVLGDDSIGAFNLMPYENGFDLKRAASDLKRLDFELSTEKSFTTENIKEVEFLGRMLYNRQSTRETADILLRVLYPARIDRSDVDLATRLVAMYYENGGGNRVLSHFLKDMYNVLVPYRLRSALAGRKDLWSPHLLKLFKMMGISAPVCAIPGDSELYALVHMPKNKIDRYSFLTDGPRFILSRQAWLVRNSSLFK